MKRIIINYDKYSEFLTAEGLSKALSYKDEYMENRPSGFDHGVLWIKESSMGSDIWYIHVHHTKKSIIVNIKMQ